MTEAAVPALRSESLPTRFPLEMTAAVARSAGAPFSLETVQLSEPRADEVLVRLVATGMCHTDLSARAGELPMSLPAVPGHEGAGVVEMVGSDVDYVVPGDHVVLTHLSCGECAPCRSGEPTSCTAFGALCFGGARIDGSHALGGSGGEVLSDRFFGQSSFAPFAIVHQRGLVKIRDDVPLELMGPLGCGVATGAGTVWNVLKTGPGSTIAIFGAGGVGLSAAMAARAAGATTIVCVDPVRSRLDLALELGATHVVNADVDDVASAVRATTGDGVDAALDTTGRADVIGAALQALRQRGKLAVVAVSEAGGVQTIPLFDVIMGCKSIVGVVEGGGSARSTIEKLVNLFADGRFPFDKLTRFYDLARINAAAEESLSGKVIKPIIRF